MAKNRFITLLLSFLVVMAGCSGDSHQGPVAVEVGTDTAEKSRVSEQLNDENAPVAGTNQLPDDRTPFQETIDRNINKRTSKGLSGPKVTYKYEADSAVPLSASSPVNIQPGTVITVTAVTTLEYDGPEQAGLTAWPRIVIKGEAKSDAEGFVRPGDYTEAYMDAIDKEVPGYWEDYEYGSEPRTFTFTETMVVSYPADAGKTGSASDDVVMGRSFVGPDIAWSVTEDACTAGVCAYSFYAGFDLDWSLGLRLPMEITVDAANSVLEGSMLNPASSARGVNWSAADYTAAGIEPEDGDEFLFALKFILGVFVDVAEIEVIGIGPNLDVDESSSFVTPFGPGAAFDLPTIDLPIWSESVSEASAEFGIGVTPQAGSRNVKANWRASGEATGSGSVTYASPSKSELLGAIKAADGPGAVDLRVDGFKYVFNQFYLDLSAYFAIDIFGLFDERYSIPITDFDLSDIVPDISVPVHPGSSPTSVSTGITVENVAPTAAIAIVGEESVEGRRTVFASIGEPVTMTGSSTDPGRDDLNFQWDFGEGLPTSVVSVDYPLASPTGPNNVSANQTYEFSSACLAGVSLVVTDSDGASNEDRLSVISRSAGPNPVRMAGYWQHQFRGRGNVDFSAEELVCYLDMVAYLSAFFGEESVAATVPDAFDVLNVAGNSGSDSEKLDRELMVAWLNFANGAFDYFEMVDTDGDEIGDMTFADAVAYVESVRMDPLSTARDLQQARVFVHGISAYKEGTLVAGN